MRCSMARQNTLLLGLEIDKANFFGRAGSLVFFDRSVGHGDGDVNFFLGQENRRLEGDFSLMIFCFEVHSGSHGRASLKFRNFARG